VLYTVALHIKYIVLELGNSSYECRLPNGDRVLSRKGNDKKYHAIGELSVIGKDTLRDHFLALQPFSGLSAGSKP
jgi:hypothetical protein